MSELDGEPTVDNRQKWWQLSERAKGNIGFIALYFGLAANFAPFLSGEILQWWQLALTCSLLVLMIVGLAILVRPKRSVPISIFVAAVLVAGAMGVPVSSNPAGSGRASMSASGNPVLGDSPPSSSTAK